jgi:membrane protease subunit HflC
MNKLITIAGAMILLVIFVCYMCSFKVRSTEVAVLKTSGRFTQDDIITEPGLRWKLPWPFQDEVVTDKRIRILEDDYEEVQTKDSQNIMVTLFVCWRVDAEADGPYKFHIASNSARGAEEKLRTMVQAEKKTVIARHDLSDLINTDPEAFKFDDIEQQLLTRTREIAKKQYGIDIVDVGIRRLSFPKAITNEVFARMKKTEENKVARFEAEGHAEAQAILAKASAVQHNIMAVAKRLAEQIRATAQEEVGVYYAEFDKEPDLRLFLDRVKAIKAMLKERTTLIMDDLSPNWLMELVQGEQTSAVAPVDHADTAIATGEQE